MKFRFDHTQCSRQWKCAKCIAQGKLANSLFLSEKALESHQSFMHSDCGQRVWISELKKWVLVSKPQVEPKNKDEEIVSHEEVPNPDLGDILFNIIESEDNDSDNLDRMEDKRDEHLTKEDLTSFQADTDSCHLKHAT